MDIWDLTTGITFLSQTSTGILGNFSFIFYYLVLYYRECILKPTDLILTHLMAANALVILSSGVPHTVAAFGVKQFLNDFGCRFVLYIQGIGRNVSIGTTCLLSVFQAMTIGPRKSWWKNHQVKAAKYIGSSLYLLWVLYIAINFIFFVYTSVKRKSVNVTRKGDFGFCSIELGNELIELLYAALIVGPEVFFSVLIAYSSGSMIVRLYRHKQRVKHIYTTRASKRVSPESRATQSILTLVSSFLAFYSLSSILRGCFVLLNSHSWWLVNITCLVSLCFPSFGPFVFMNYYSIESRLGLVWRRIKNHLLLC